MSGPAASRAGDFEHHTTRSGLDVYVLPTRKWKTKLLRLHARAPLSERNAARALLPNLLRRGTVRRPSMAAVSRALEALYGASFTNSAHKQGDEQVISFRLETVGERYLPGQPAVFAPAVELARELLHEPYLPGGTFPVEVFAQERLNHQREIDALFNDKQTFAWQRLFDLAFGDEPFGRPVLGTAAEASALRPEDALKAHAELLARSPMCAFAVGDFAPGEAVAVCERLLPAAQSAPRRVPTSPRRPPRSAPQLVVERDRVSQSKLVTARRVDLDGLSEREFDALRVHAGILGGGFHSRLFQSVREEHSLAYSVSSSVDRLRGVLYTSAGIDANARSKVIDLVEQEIASLRTAPPRDEELSQTKNLIVSGTRSLLDSAGGMVDSLEAGLAAGRVRALEEIACAVAQVTAADVQAVAQRIGPPDVIFCLEGETRPAGA
ncbi:MAG: insulinase family protein [Planctomycetes bacterium]|nr:insulinase family protein [Planctomycetota bacterium]